MVTFISYSCFYFVFTFDSDSSQPFQFAGAGQALFGSARKTDVTGDDDDDVERPPDVEFTPIVSLPEVEVVTGEEDEQVLFSHRGKCFRFVSNEKERAWKERGVGEVKILKHKQTGTLPLSVLFNPTLIHLTFPFLVVYFYLSCLLFRKVSCSDATRQDTEDRV